MPKPTPPRPDTRERLYADALVLFRAEGFNAVPVSRLTRETGVAKGTFFLHFPTKEHLLARWLSERLDEVEMEVRTRGWGGTDAIVEFLDRLARILQDGDPELGRAALSAWGHLPPPEEGASAPRHRLQGWLRFRLDETLAIAVPLATLEHGPLASLLMNAFEGSLREDAEAESAKSRGGSRLVPRILFLLESAGLPASPPSGS